MIHVQNNRKDPPFSTELLWCKGTRVWGDMGTDLPRLLCVHLLLALYNTMDGFRRGICFPVQPGSPQAGYTGINAQFTSTLLVEGILLLCWLSESNLWRLAGGKAHWSLGPSPLDVCGPLHFVLAQRQRIRKNNLLVLLVSVADSSP